MSSALSKQDVRLKSGCQRARKKGGLVITGVNLQHTTHSEVSDVNGEF